MANHLSTVLTLAAAAALLTAGAADAQTAKRAHAAQAKAHHPVIIAEMSDATAIRPLTVQKRSFLDPGNAVPVGEATPEYIVANTTQNVPVYRTYDTACFGESELPGRFDLPPSNPRYNPSSEPRLPLPFDE